MEVTELMVGDWVYQDVPEQPCFQIEDFYDLGDADDFNPISITPEILEKNGFKKIPNYDVWLFKQKDIEIRVPLDSFRTFICCKYHTVRCKIAYVHELQHALRLCKINKEIVL